MSSRRRIIALFFAALALAHSAIAQTIAVTQSNAAASRNQIAHDLKFGSGRTLTIMEGATLDVTGATLVGFTAGTGDITSNTETSVDGELALFNSTTGKQIKRATTTGILKATSGVLAAAVAGTDYLAPAAIGVSVQAYDADLTTYAGITPSANVQTLLGAANYAAFRSSLSAAASGGNADITATTALNSITAASATNLSLLGGSTGAQLTLGQGENGVATLNRSLFLGGNLDGAGSAAPSSAMLLSAVSSLDTASSPWRMVHHVGQFDGVYDPVLTFGYNVANDSGRLNASDSSVRLGLEADYYVNIGARGAGLQHYQESYLRFIGSGGNSLSGLNILSDKTNPFAFTQSQMGVAGAGAKFQVMDVSSGSDVPIFGVHVTDQAVLMPGRVLMNVATGDYANFYRLWIQESTAGTQNTFRLQHKATSGAGSISRFLLDTAAGGGDPFVAWQIGATEFSVGLDNSDSDKFGIWGHSEPGTNPVFTVASGTSVATFAQTIAGSINGNAGTATALQTARNIGGSSFDGTANVTSFPAPGAIGGVTPAAGTFTDLAATTITTGNTGLGLLDTNASHVLVLSPGANLTANRTLTLTTADANTSVTLPTSGTLATTAQLAGVIGFQIDGAGSPPATGEKAKTRLQVPFACTITKATLICDPSGSAVVDVWKDTNANFPPTNADSITASAKPTISAATKSEDATLTGWTTSVAAGDWIVIEVESASTLTGLSLFLEYSR